MRRLALTLAGLVALSAPAVFAQGAGFSQNPADAPAGAYALDKRHASVVASISHFGFSNYTFVFRDLDATLQYDARNPTASKITFSVDPKSIDTGLADFDKKLASDDWLGSAPARFVSTGLRASGPRTGKLTGNLTLKGVTRPATFDVTFNGGGPSFQGTPTIGFRAEGVIDRSQFGVNNMVGPLGRDVRLVVEAEFNKVP
jgi:polyisoprenoid-binding protein YceI